MKVGRLQIVPWARGLLIVFYILAGINHFWHPGFYLPLIPDYLPQPKLLNAISGWAEILLGLGMAFEGSRHWAAIGLVAMLIVFVPSHVHFIQIGSCVEGGLCTPAWVAWLRLVLIHPLLILWVWKVK
ncbi:MAG: hypothetical protein AAFV25_18290 [Bacteroidota bacterium]